VTRASSDARELAHGAVEAPHILLALAELEPRVGGAVDVDALRGRVVAAYPQGVEPRRGRMRFGHTAKHALGLAMHEAVERGAERIETRDLALGLTRHGAPRESLAPLEVDFERIRGAFDEEEQ
jgi:hypothetical protein